MYESLIILVLPPTFAFTHTHTSSENISSENSLNVCSVKVLLKAHLHTPKQSKPTTWISVSYFNKASMIIQQPTQWFGSSSCSKIKFDLQLFKKRLCWNMTVWTIFYQNKKKKRFAMRNKNWKDFIELVFNLFVQSCCWWFNVWFHLLTELLQH